MVKLNRFMALAFVITSILFCGCNSKDDKSSSELTSLHGTWVGKELGRDGEVKVTGKVPKAEEIKEMLA